MRIYLIFILLVSPYFLFAQGTIKWTELIGEYLGQTLPGDSAVVFAPGIISLPGRTEQQINFTTDGLECYLGVYANETGKIYCYKYVNEKWTEEKVPFTINKSVFLNFLSPDGNSLYFSNNGLYKVERKNNKWGEPLILPSPINSGKYNGGYTETDDGIIYLVSSRDGGYTSRGDIWRIHPDAHKADNLGREINTGNYIASPCISRDGSYLVFSAIRPGCIGNQDLFICFKKGNGEFTAPVNMEINSAGINLANHTQNCPSISPDGKYLFFRRHDTRGRNHDIYWVSSTIVDKLKEKSKIKK